MFATFYGQDCSDDTKFTVPCFYEAADGSWREVAWFPQDQDGHAPWRQLGVLRVLDMEEAYFCQPCIKEVDGLVRKLELFWDDCPEWDLRGHTWAAFFQEKLEALGVYFDPLDL